MLLIHCATFRKNTIKVFASQNCKIGFYLNPLSLFMYSSQPLLFILAAPFYKNFKSNWSTNLLSHFLNGLLIEPLNRLLWHTFLKFVKLCTIFAKNMKNILNIISHDLRHLFTYLVKIYKWILFWFLYFAFLRILFSNCKIWNSTLLFYF